MRSYKRKILKRGRNIRKYKNPTRDQIRKVMSYINSGQIAYDGFRGMGKSLFVNKDLRDKLKNLNKINKAKQLQNPEA